MKYDYTAIGGTFEVADGNNVAILSLQNKVGSPFLLEINRVSLMSASLVAVTGVGVRIDVSRLTAITESGGTAGLLTPMDSGAVSVAEIVTYISPYTGAGTFTVGHIVAHRAVNNDEISLTGQSDIVRRPIWTPADPEKPLIIKPTESIAIIQYTSSTAGGWIPQIDFTINRQKGG